MSNALSLDSSSLDLSNMVDLENISLDLPEMSSMDLGDVMGNLNLSPVSGGNAAVGG